MFSLCEAATCIAFHLVASSLFASAFVSLQNKQTLHFLPTQTNAIQIQNAKPQTFNIQVPTRAAHRNRLRPSNIRQKAERYLSIHLPDMH